MYIFNALSLLLTPGTDFGSPSDVLLPLLAGVCLVLQLLIMLRRHRPVWLLPVISAAMMLLMKLLLHLVHTYTAMLFIIIMVYAAAALLGTCAGALVAAAVKPLKRRKDSK